MGPVVRHFSQKRREIAVRYRPIVIRRNGKVLRGCNAADPEIVARIDVDCLCYILTRATKIGKKRKRTRVIEFADEACSARVGQKRLSEPGPEATVAVCRLVGELVGAHSHWQMQRGRGTAEIE